MESVRRQVSRTLCDSTADIEDGRLDAAVVDGASTVVRPVVDDAIHQQVDERTRAVLDYRRRSLLPARRGWLVHRALLLSDLLGLLIGFLAASTLVSSTGPTLTGPEEAALLVLSLPVWILLLKLHGLYDKDDEATDHSTVDEIVGVFHVLTVGAWVFYVLVRWTDLMNVPLDRLVTFWVTAIIAIPIVRAITRTLYRRSLAFMQNTVIVGTGPVARLVARKLLRHPEYGINLVGFVDAAPAPRSGSLASLPVLGPPERLKELKGELGLERVIIAFTPDSHDYTLDVIRTARDLDIQVDIVPRLFEVLGANSSLHMLEGIPLLGLPQLRLSPSSRALKRTLDIVGAGAGLLLLSPLFLVTALAIRLDSRGPVFFKQLRRGSGSTTFRIFKFRTMFVDAERQKAALQHLNMHVDDDPRMFKITEDPRVTRVGGLLRRTSIDEIPQLINVLRGEMSLVGPRPLILEEDEHVESWARRRLDLKPGMTGLWQVLGRSDIPFDEMTKLDYLYVTSWSLKEDFRLILLTLPALFRARQAY